MKNKFLILFTTLSLSIFAMLSFKYSNTKFYYAYEEKIYLTESNNRLIVRYKQNKNSDITKISLYTELFDKPIEWKDDSTFIITLDESKLSLFKEKILSQNDVKSCNPLYLINTGLEMGVTDEFLVKFNEDVSTVEIENLNKRYGVEIVKTTDIYQLLKVPAGSDALEIANKYQESGLTRFSYPNFICEIEFHQVIPNDQYFINQFSLHNTGQVFTDGHSGTVDADIDAPEAWAITKGNNNIIIAVLDQGVTSDHPDLPNTRQVRLNGSNFGNGDPNNPSPTGNQNHGNSCAGIIGATQNNNQGISGIAPYCRIMPVRIVGASTGQIADAIEFAMDNNAHIISNSWGYRTTNPNFSPAIRDAIIAATSQGRNWLGCVVVFSASNSADHVHGNNGYVAFPANVNVAGVLTIGPSDRYDLQANYSPTSNPGSPNNQIIDMVAPSHLAYSYQIPTETLETWTIDIPGLDGYNPVHETDGGALPVIGSTLSNSGVNYLYYTGRFGGTSYACPEVAGVAALLLSINPNLTQLQVFNILTSTADRVDGYVYTNGRSNELGYGRLNACEAVTQAMSTLTISGPTIVCTSNSTFTLNNIPPRVSVNWNVYPPNMVTPYSGTGSTATFHATCNQMGNCTLYFTISSECGPVQVSKSLISGGPDPYDVDLDILYSTGRPAPKSGEIFLLCPNTTYHIYLMNSNGCSTSNYIWTIPTAWTKWYQYNNMISINTNSQPGGQIMVDATTCCPGCGTERILIDYVGQYWDCGGYYMAFPNPADDYLDIDINEDKMASDGLSIGNEYVLTMVDKMGTVKYTDEFKEFPYRINTKDIPEGLYIINLIYDSKISSIKVMIEH